MMMVAKEIKKERRELEQSHHQRKQGLVKVYWEEFGTVQEVNNSLMYSVYSAKHAEFKYFDKEFYDDQKGERKLHVYLSKVTKEFVEEEKARKLRQIKSSAYKISAKGNFCPQQ